jgi:hypothetical protein
MSPPELDELTDHMYASGSAGASEDFEKEQDARLRRRPLKGVVTAKSGDYLMKRVSRS